MKNYFIDLTMFGGDKDFFMSAFDEAYPITTSEVEEVTEESSEPVQEPVSTPVEEIEEIPSEKVEPPKELSDEEILALYEKKFGKIA